MRTIQENLPAAQDDLASAIRSQATVMESFKDAVVSFGKDMGSVRWGRSGEESGERCSTILGIHLKKDPPQLLDSNPNFDDHWDEFQSQVDCYAAEGRRL